MPDRIDMRLRAMAQSPVRAEDCCNGLMLLCIALWIALHVNRSECPGDIYAKLVAHAPWWMWAYGSAISGTLLVLGSLSLGRKLTSLGYLASISAWACFTFVLGIGFGDPVLGMISAVQLLRGFVRSVQIPSSVNG